MTHSDLSLSLARRSDASAIARMSCVLIEYGLQWKWTAQRVEASICAANVNVLVARFETRIIGFAIMRYGDDDAHLDLLAVAPPYRRLGVGQELLRSVRRWREFFASAWKFEKATVGRSNFMSVWVITG